ncbi:MAG: methionyl-tRNA formyltransferase [Candidatus Omnitrophica bacterium]|nr:methionyl-tRNA formyltransferase [Candidatus Omnitrophota bacterium]
MRIVYFGSSEFSKIVLERIYNRGRVPIIVVSVPDKCAGRHLKLKPTPVKVFSKSCSLEVITPENLDDSNFVNLLRGMNIDLFVVVGFGKIIPRSLLMIPKIMPIALHPSLLPLYRGASPINWAIIKGESKTGVTVFKVNETIDRGEIILQEEVLIEDNDDSLTLSLKLANMGSNLLLRSISAIEENRFSLKPQDESKATFAPKLKKIDGRICWDKDANSIRNLVRGIKDWPQAYTCYKGKMLKILEVEVEKEDFSLEPSTVVKVEKNGIYVATGKGIIKIIRLKPEGKREMLAGDFICGYRIKVGDNFE